MSKATIMYTLIAAIVLAAMAAVRYLLGGTSDEVSNVGNDLLMWFILWIGCKAAYRER